MELVSLGCTRLRVSRVCFGALTIGPLQKDIPLDEGAGIIIRALERGVNFIDTAASYRTYAYIASALSRWKRDDIVIASKSHAYSQEEMRADVERCLRELGRDYVDIFLLHEQESRLTLKGHRPALEFLLRARDRGLVRAVGISSHTVEAVDAAADMEEIEIIHPMINKTGIGIKDGTRDDMLHAIKKAHSRGKGIYAMKPFGGGHLISQAKSALSWVLSQKCIHSVAVGMGSKEEVDVNTAWAEGKQVDPELEKRLASKKRALTVADWCVGCGSCVHRCRHGALEIKEGRAGVNMEKCVLCGYCAAVCPDFCIKVY